MTEPDVLLWLASWYAEQCDGEWEHEFGISISTIDNPGWNVTIELSGTELEFREFTAHEEDDGVRWMQVFKVSGPPAFRGAGSPEMLADILGHFRRWVSG